MSRSPNLEAARVRRIVALTIASTVLAVAIAFTVWDRNFNRAAATNPGTSCPTIVQPSAHPPLVSISIKRVALIGDSIMNQASCSIADSLARAGIQTGRYAVGGSGLLSGPVDWLRTASKILASQHPDVVIAIFVGNYWPSLSSLPSTVREDSPEFFSLWQQRAVKLSNEVTSANAEMFWVSPPPIQFPLLAHAQRLFDGYRTISGTHTIDAGRVLADADGHEVTSLVTCGRVAVVRTSDGVHLTEDGARIYGQEIAHEFTAQTGLLTSPKPC